jgi:hypothetical protein
MEDLLQQEKNLERDLMLLQSQLTETLEDTSSYIIAPVNQVGKHSMESTSSDPSVFYTFLSKEGGHTGGWDRLAHEQFTAIRKQCHVLFLFGSVVIQLL